MIDVRIGKHALHRAACKSRFRRVITEHPPRQRKFILARWKGHANPHHEAVLLRLGQRIRSLKFNRVLRCENREIRRQRVRLAIDGYGAFLHRLKQGGLRFGRRAINFIGQQKSAKDRSLY